MAGIGTIGENIAELRIASGISIEEMAAYIGFDTEELARLESGEAKAPHVTVLSRIGELFAMTAMDVVSGKSQECGLTLRQLRKRDLATLARINRIIKSVLEINGAAEKQAGRSNEDELLGGKLDAETARRLSEQNDPYQAQIDAMLDAVLASVRQATQQGKRVIEADEDDVKSGLWPYVHKKLEMLGYQVDNQADANFCRLGAMISW